MSTGPVTIFPGIGSHDVLDGALSGSPGDRLRIGLMLRAIDDVDGQGIYIRKLCDALFDVDPQNEYVAFYARPARRAGIATDPTCGRSSYRGNGKLLWDQVLVPLAARREHLDVLFHHKFSIPLVPPCPTVVQQRGHRVLEPSGVLRWAGRGRSTGSTTGDDPALLPAGRAGAHQLGQPG